MRCCGLRTKTIRCRRRAVTGFYCRRCTWQGFVLLFAIPIGLILYTSEMGFFDGKEALNNDDAPVAQVKVAELAPATQVEEVKAEQPEPLPILAANDTPKVTPFVASSMIPLIRRAPSDHRTATPSDGSFDLPRAGSVSKAPVKKQPKFRIQF